MGKESNALDHQIRKEADALAPSCGYFPRYLRAADGVFLGEPLDEAGLAALPGVRIVLAEPGMGKSELLRELGRRLEIEPVTATRFMNARDPTKLLVTGKPLIIDALDEAMARREGSAVDKILAQLEDVGSPPFILSCRTREWQARSVVNLRHLYGVEPRVFDLAPFSRSDARRFLAERYPTADAGHVLEHLDKYTLSDLYRNPLTLGLMGQVAKTDTQLPATRAALFEQVCMLLWKEYDLAREDTNLAQLSVAEALDGAGAIAASLLLAGSEAASVAGAAQLQDGDIRVADVERLPKGNAARAVFSSKLFISIGISRAKPIHRVIAEFLGARWIARQASTPRTRRRLLAQFHYSGGVPTSLRGLHAWLAYHSPMMADAVIAADPYGLLRYGEPAAFTPHQTDMLFDALCALAKDDPWFHVADWDSRTAAALMTPGLKDRIDAIIASSESNEHLRSLLIEGLDGTPLAGELAGTLEAILLMRSRSYRERRKAIDVLAPHRPRTWWQGTVIKLRDQATHDAMRLACDVIDAIDADIPDRELIMTLFGELGMTVCAFPQEIGRRHAVRHHGRLLQKLTDARLPAVLDLIADYVDLIGEAAWEHENEVADIVAQLIVHAIDTKVTNLSDAPRLWRWLGVIERAHGYHRDHKKKVDERLAADKALRQAVQIHALTHDRRNDSLWVTEIGMQSRLVGLTSHAGDLTNALERLVGLNNKDEARRSDWRDLLRLTHGAIGLTAEVRAIAERFMAGDRQLAAFLARLENRKKPPWEAKREKRKARRARKRAVGIELARRRYGADGEKLRLGEFAAIFGPACAYLGMFADLSREQSPIERIAEWLGSDIRTNVLVGFEAVLHRGDLPSAKEIAEGFAGDTIYHFCYPIMAGLFERIRTGKGTARVPADVLLTGLLLCYSDHNWHVGEALDTLRDTLEVVVIPTQPAREAFARLWIEPALAKRRSYISGLYKLTYDPAWHATGAALAGGWLTTFPDVAAPTELALVDCLTHAGALQALAQVAATRAGTVFCNFERMLSWLAIDILVRFPVVQPHVTGIGACHPEFIWDLRNRFRSRREGAPLPVTIVQAAWIVAEFRVQWSFATLQGSGSGDTNPHDATDFLRKMLYRIADDTSVEAADAVQTLVTAPADSYSELIQHMAAEQRQKRAEEDFSGMTPVQLGELLADDPPANIEDLKSVVREELDIAQKKLRGEDIDQVRDFWTDTGIPRDENRCRDRLAAIIGPELDRYAILRITEADMPMTKRADLAYARNPLQLPMEIKGQWHTDVWDAASGQLDAQYLVDWRSEQRGIYWVLWFGDVPSNSNRRLKAHPDGLATPASAEVMHEMVIARIPEARRALIDVVVLDLSAGKPPPPAKGSGGKKGADSQCGGSVEVT